MATASSPAAPTTALAGSAPAATRARAPSTMVGSVARTACASKIPASSGLPAARIRSALADRIRAAGRPDDAGIFEAQAVLATDPTIVDGALALVAAGADPASAVVGAAGEEAVAIASPVSYTHLRA